LSYRFKDKKTNETSVDFALQLLSEFSKGISRIGGAYPLDKLYSIALPHFYFSAMENWGMMTFKYPIILTVPHLATMAEKTRVREVVIHEMAHQVFGNLVGIDWWSHVWLKEGFATFYSQVGWPTVLNSSWIHEDPQVAPPIAYFASKMRQQALNFDEGLDTHPLENEPKVSAEIAGIYTKIPYDKGGSVIRMMFDFLQHPNSSFTEQDTSFTRGIQLYVKRM
jgi:aminopeptidase N